MGSRRPLMSLLFTILATAALLLAPTTVSASPVHAGLDFFETVPTSFQDFSATPLPPGFFGPGSDPFSGNIFFQGVPLGPDSTADTVVARRDRANFPHPFPSSDAIPIEIVALNLSSVSAITVTYNGGANPELWMVNVGLSATPAPTGTMRITHVDNNGGTFDSVLPVSPRFTFTRVSDSQTQVLDFGQLGLRPINFQATGVPWTHRVPKHIFASRRFCASCGPNGERVETSELASLAAHNIVPALRIP